MTDSNPCRPGPCTPGGDSHCTACGHPVPFRAPSAPLSLLRGRGAAGLTQKPISLQDQRARRRPDGYGEGAAFEFELFEPGPGGETATGYIEHGTHPITLMTDVEERRGVAFTVEQAEKVGRELLDMVATWTACGGRLCDEVFTRREVRLTAQVRRSTGELARVEFAADASKLSDADLHGVLGGLEPQLKALAHGVVVEVEARELDARAAKEAPVPTRTHDADRPAPLEPGSAPWTYHSLPAGDAPERQAPSFQVFEPAEGARWSTHYIPHPSHPVLVRTAEEGVMAFTLDDAEKVGRELVEVTGRVRREESDEGRFLEDAMLWLRAGDGARMEGWPVHHVLRLLVGAELAAAWGTLGGTGPTPRSALVLYEGKAPATPGLLVCGRMKLWEPESTAVLRETWFRVRRE